MLTLSEHIININMNLQYHNKVVTSEVVTVTVDRGLHQTLPV